MRTLMRMTPLLCCVGCTVLLGLFWRGTAQPGAPQSQSTTTQRPKDPAHAEFERRIAELPVVDWTEFDPVATTDPKRGAKNKKYNAEVSVDGTRAPRFDESMEPVLGELPITHTRAEPAFPITSDVIVVGTIREAKAYLSEDRTAVYSEVSLAIEEILKADPQYELKVGGTVSGDRRGGGVRFPSGKILRREYWMRRIPSAGRRYLLFLKDRGDAEFSIVTGYELTGKGVQPLDGDIGNNDSVYTNYERLRNTSEALLLDAVKKAIKESGSGMGGAR